MAPDRPVRTAVVDDFDVIVEGTAALLAPHPQLVQLVELTTEGISEPVDVALLDCFGTAEAHAGIVGEIAEHPLVGSVAVYTWNFSPALIDRAFELGASAYLSKGLPGAELAKAIVAAASDERVVVDAGAVGRPEVGRRWPGRELGLTEREAEVLAHITQGKRTREIADALYLSVNSIKTHTQHLYRKIGVTSRTEAALWGVDHGFRPDRDTRTVWSA